MSGLLDHFPEFLKSPEGQGLLSTVFGGLAGAQRGAPLNSLGRAGMSGLMGYGQAQERQAQLAHEQQAANLRDMQIKQMQQKMQDEADVRTMAGQFFKPGATTEQIFSAPGQAGPTVARAGLQATASQPSFDTNGFVGALFAKNPSLGLQYQQAFAKETPFNKVDAKDYTPESVLRFSQTRNYGDLVPRSKMEVSPGGMVYDPYRIQPGTTMQDPNKAFSLGADGKPVANLPFQQFEIHKSRAGAPNMTSINNVQAYEPFANKLQGQMGEALVKNYETLSSIPQTLKALDTAKGLVPTASTFMGSQGENKLAMAKFFNDNLGTSIKPESIKDAEKLRSALFYNVMDNLKKMDASPSQEQQRMMQDAFGRLNNDPKALPEIIDMYKGLIVSKAQEHNKRVQQTMTGPAAIKYPYDISIKIPESGANNDPSQSVVRVPVKTGMYGGKKVYQYSDGSIDYGNN